MKPLNGVSFPQKKQSKRDMERDLKRFCQCDICENKNCEFCFNRKAYFEMLAENSD